MLLYTKGYATASGHPKRLGAAQITSLAWLGMRGGADVDSPTNRQPRTKDPTNVGLRKCFT